MNLGRALLATVMVVSIGTGCGSGDDDSDAAGDASAGTVAAPDVTSPQAAAVTDGIDDAVANDAAGEPGDAAEFGDNGGIDFTFSGGHDESGKYVWVPVASSYAPGWWSMSFTEPTGQGAAVLALSLDPSNTNFSFGDGEITIFGAAAQCSFNIDHQDSSGASGSFECSDLTALTVTEMVPDVSVSATFDAKY